MSTPITEEQVTDLAILPRSVSIIIAADKNDLLGKLAEKIRVFNPDVSTVRGRKDIASLAAEVASTKMDLIRLGKGLTECWRKSTAAVNAECKIIEERMDQMKVKVRAPLTAFENNEKDRIASHEAALTAISGFCAFDGDPTADDIILRIAQLHDMPDRDWQEFADRAKQTFLAADGRLRDMHERAVQREAEAAEVARILAEENERQRKAAIQAQREHEARIAAEAADRARLEAERRAEVERQASAQREREAQARAAKAEAERQAAQEAAERRERELIAKAERDRQAAVERERKRIAAEEAAAQAEADRRAADNAHREAVNRAVVASLTGIEYAQGGRTEHLSGELAKTVVTWIALGKIPHIRIEY